MGSVFIGSRNLESHVIFDTMQPKININLLKTDGEVRKSVYETRESDTAKPIKFLVPNQGN